MDISEIILVTYDKPDWVHSFLSILLEKKFQFIESMKGAKFDLIETGGDSFSIPTPERLLLTLRQENARCLA